MKRDVYGHKSINDYYENRDYSIREYFENELKKYIGKKKVVLNLGCGDGWESRVIDNHAEMLICSDISKDQLEIFSYHKENKNRNPVRSDWDIFPFRDHTFDAVVMFNSIHHSHNLQRTLNEIYRILKPGGMLLCVKEPICPFLLSWFWKTRLKQEHGHLEGHEKENNLTIYEWGKSFLESDFKEVHIKPSEITVGRYLKSNLRKLNRRYRVGKLNWDEKIARRLEIIKIMPFRILNSISEPLAEKNLFIFQKNLFAMNGITLIATKPQIK